MRIISNSSVTRATGRKKNSKGQGSGFEINQPGAKSEAHPAVANSSMPSISGLIAVQEVAVKTPREQALAFGNELLDQLDELKTGWLAGHVSQGKIARLNRSLAMRKNQLDDQATYGSEIETGLAETIKWIDLRARVELAKIEKFNR